jgi:catechol 2,3-dioxygenase-like lactoylglutathione lyase family enzyme
VSGTDPGDSADFPGLGGPDDPVGAAGAAGPVTGFRATRRGVTCWFAPPQAGIIRTLVGQVAELLGSGEEATAGEATTGKATAAEDPLEGSWDSPEEFAAMLGLSASTNAPEDPVLARLLPDGYRDDAEAAGDFRRYTEEDLRSGKVAAARTVLATLPEGGGHIQLSADDAQVWLRAINDVRLALGVRLSITEDFQERMDQLDPDDPRSAYFWVYDWLTYLQETLVRALW